MISRSRGLYWEDFEVGQTLVTPEANDHVDRHRQLCVSVRRFQRSPHELGVRQDDAVRRADRTWSVDLRDHGGAAVREWRQ
jgi:hypothetical protein